MKHKSEALYTTGLIVRTTFRFLLKNMGISFYGAMAVALCIDIYLLATGNRTILTAVFSGVLIFGVLIFLRMYSHYFSGANKDLKNLKGKSVAVTFRENGISFDSDSESLKWKDITKVWLTKEAYLFFTAKDRYVIFPLAGLGDEIKAFVDDKLGEFRIPRQ